MQQSMDRVQDEEWASFDQAAHELALSLRRVQLLAYAGTLELCDNRKGERGVTRVSVQRHCARRNEISRRARIWQGIKTFFKHSF